MSRFAVPSAVTCSLLLGAFAPAAPAADKVQPDSLPVGTLYVGAVAEASFLIFAPADDPNPKIKVDPPKFVKVLNTGTHAQTFGNRGAFTCVTVEVEIDTAKAGEFKGEIAVTVGETVTKVPVTATVKARKVGAPRVLIVGTPFERYSNGEGKNYKGWTDAAEAASLDVGYLLVRKDKPFRDLDLSKFECVLLGPEILVGLAADDTKLVRAFAENGGRVVVAANAFFVGSVNGANAVLDGSGLTMSDKEAPGPKDVVVKKEHLADEVAKAGVEKVRFYRASPVRAEKGGRVLVGSPEFVDPDAGYAATAKVGKGEVVALGVSLWWDWVSEGRAKDTHNAKLLGWLLTPPRKG